jgi:hypothetical protein
MRSLYRSGLRDLATIVPAYAQMERDGVVRRIKNVNGISPEEYADRLFRDGLTKGWLNR